MEKGDREQAKRQRTEAQRSSKAATSNKRGTEEDISSPSSQGSKLQKRDEIQEVPTGNYQVGGSSRGQWKSTLGKTSTMWKGDDACSELAPNSKEFYCQISYSVLILICIKYQRSNSKNNA